MFEPCSLLEIHKHMLTLKRSRNYKAIKHAPFQEFAKRTERRGLLVCCISDHTWKKTFRNLSRRMDQGAVLSVCSLPTCDTVLPKELLQLHAS